MNLSELLCIDKLIWLNLKEEIFFGHGFAEYAAK